MPFKEKRDSIHRSKQQLRERAHYRNPMNLKFVHVNRSKTMTSVPLLACAVLLCAASGAKVRRLRKNCSNSNMVERAHLDNDARMRHFLEAARAQLRWQFFYFFIQVDANSATDDYYEGRQTSSGSMARKMQKKPARTRLLRRWNRRRACFFFPRWH